MMRRWAEVLHFFDFIILVIGEPSIIREYYTVLYKGGG